MNLIPTQEQVSEWIRATQLEPHGEGWSREQRIAELAARWGYEQAIKDHVLLNALESAKQQMQEGEPHGLTMDIVRKGDSLLVHATSLTKVADQAQVEEPELPEPVDLNPAANRVLGYTATQMHDHFQAGVREGAARSQDARRYQWLREQQWRDNKLGVVLRPKDNTVLGCFIPSKGLLDEVIDRYMSGKNDAMKGGQQ